MGRYVNINFLHVIHFIIAKAKNKHLKKINKPQIFFIRRIAEKTTEIKELKPQILGT